MKAVVLAAGEGQRLRPLTFTRPKHMIPIGGKPLLEHLLVALKEAGINEVLVVVHYRVEQIKDYFGDGSKLGMRINYAFQKEMRGTADAFGFAENYVDGDFLAAYGDLLVTSGVIKSVLQLHNEVKPAATLAAVHVEHPEHYGILKTEGQEVVGIVEKPSPGVAADNPVNAGVYVFSRDIFEAIRQTGTSPRGEREITDSIRQFIEEGELVLAAKIPAEEWLDVGKPWDLLEANMRVLTRIKPEILGSVEDNVHLKGQIFVSEGATIRSGTYIEGPAFIGEASDIGPNCYIRPYTSIGRNVRIGNACEIKASIIMDSAHIGHLSYVGDSVIGEGCNLGAGTITANLRLDDGTVKMRIKGEVVDSGRRKMGVFMGDNVKTGIGTLLMPGKTIGCNCWIGPNLVVNEDVQSDSILILKQQIERRSR
ncbi:MAG: sugar phosphate nucleotidyltransferase [Nitrososphaerota archaeon]